MRTLLLSSIVAASLAAFACGDSAPPPQTPATPAASAPDTSSTAAPSDKASTTADAGSATSSETPGSKTPEPAPEASKFETLPKDKKAEVMMTKVVPNVGKLFKEQNPKKYEKFGCVNCHGPTKKEDPHKVLPKLTLSKGGFEKLQKAKPEIVKFMAEKVEPTMAEALGEKPYDQTTHKGFGCAGCHTVN